MTVCTSIHVYEILSFFELEEKYQKKAKKEFDWIEDLEESYGFFIYKKEVYNLGSFMRHNEKICDEKTGKPFFAHGIYSWGYFNGLAIQFINRDQSLKIAYYY